MCFVVDGAKRLDENVTHIMRQLETNLEEVRKALKLDPQEESELNRAKKCVLVVNKVIYDMRSGANFAQLPYTKTRKPEEARFIAKFCAAPHAMYMYISNLS